MGDNPSFCRLAFGICKAQLHLSLYEVWHHFLVRYQIDFFVSIKDYAVLGFIFLDLSWPVLMALYFCILLSVSQHNNQGYTFLVHHTPKIFNCRLEWTLSSDKQLVVTFQCCINVVSIYVRVISIIIPLSEPHLRMFDYMQNCYEP